MSCHRWREVIEELARDQLLDAEVRRQALAHCLACAECSARLKQARALTAGLRALAAESAAEAPPRLEGALRAAFRTPRPVARPLRKGGVWLAAAAAVVAIIGVAVWQGRRPSPVPAPQQVAVTPALAEAPPKLPPAPPPARRASQLPARRAPRPEIATDFLPLAYVSDARELEQGSLVRVRLPRTAMASVGLPVNEELRSEPVQADIWLGQDGVARAIRFIY
jgi:hypothetical protein